MMTDRFPMLDPILPSGVVSVEAIGMVPSEPLLPEEAAVIGRASPLRRCEFTVARSCARRALGKLGLPPLPILPGPSRQPLWPEGVVGSITHCPGYCAAAVTWRAQFVTIGIDAEPNEPLPAKVFDAIALDEERASLGTQRSGKVCWDRALFSAKESVFKAWFQITGAWLGFDGAAVTIDAKRGSFIARLLVDPPVVDGIAITHFKGRFLAQAGWILSAASLKAPDHTEEWVPDIGRARPEAVHARPRLRPEIRPRRSARREVSGRRQGHSNDRTSGAYSFASWV